MRKHGPPRSCKAASGKAASGATRSGKAASSAAGCSKAASGARQPAARQPAAPREAASGSQRGKAASGAGRGVQLKLKLAGSTHAERYLRGKIRVPGLFRTRHWIFPQHCEAFIFEIEGIKRRKQFRGMTYYSTASKHIVGEYKREVQRLLEALFGSPARGGKVGQVLPPSGGEDASMLPPSGCQDESTHPPKPRVDPPGGMQAGGGITEFNLKQRVDQACNPLSKVDMQTPKDTPAAVYHTACSYMQPSCQGSAADIPWLPLEAADWYTMQHIAPFLCRRHSLGCIRLLIPKDVIWTEATHQPAAVSLRRGRVQN